MKVYESGPADERCEFSEDDPGYCLRHMAYLGDEEHPHVWEHCYDPDCPCPEPDDA